MTTMPSEEFIGSIIDDLCCISEKSEIQEIEKKHGVDISVEIEKHNSLQKTYYFNINFDGVDESYFVEIENGINNGTVVRSEYWGGSVSRDVEIEVLDDIEPDLEKMTNFFKDKDSTREMTIETAQSIAKEFAITGCPNIDMLYGLMLFKKKKPDILKLYSNQNYDNYVTGGGTISTDKHYKSEFNSLHESGIFWKNIYKTELADRNFQ